MNDDDLARAVTAIVPAYERPDYLVEAVTSALAQTYPHVEVLIGDDSRTDAVERAVRGIDDPRVRYHRNTPSLGAMGNWIDLVRRARTPLVASLNDDDRWEPQFLERTAPVMLADPTIGMAFCDFTYIDGAGAPRAAETEHWSTISHRREMAPGLVPEDPELLLRMIAVWNAPQSAYAAVLRRDAVAAIEFPRETDPCHDLWCTYRLWTGGHRFHYVAERLTRYRVHDANLTNAGFGAAEDFIWGVIAAENPTNPATAELRDRWARTRFARAMHTPPASAAQAARELRAAKDDLTGWRRTVAQVAASSNGVCHAALVGRNGLKRAIATVKR